jgi:hypothetical protein
MKVIVELVSIGIYNAILSQHRRAPVAISDIFKPLIPIILTLKGRPGPFVPCPRSSDRKGGGLVYVL